MAKFKVVGSHKVAGVAPGGVVDGDDLDGVNVAHLMSSGHLAPVKAVKPAPAKAVEADTTPDTSDEEK